MADFVLESRDSVGSLFCKKLRKNGFVSSSLRIDGNVVPVSVDKKSITAIVSNYKFLNTLHSVTFNGKKINVIQTETTFHPVNGSVLNVDFKEVKLKDVISVLVPISIVGATKSPGMKRGGKLNIIRYNIPLLCKADSIPEDVVIDISNFGIGKTFSSKLLKLPADVKCDGEFVILSIIGRGKKDVENAEGTDGDASVTVNT